MVDQAGADCSIVALNGIVLKGRKVTVKLADKNREQKSRTFKANRSSCHPDRTGDSMVGKAATEVDIQIHTGLKNR